MVVVGAAVHKRTATPVAVDKVRRRLGQVTVPATTAEPADAFGWGGRSSREELTCAVEDCQHLSARLALDLLTRREKVMCVPPKVMVEQRRVTRSLGEFDPIDALAVARAFLPVPGLPAARHASPLGRGS